MSWQHLRIAPCGTHHLDGDHPAYLQRFDDVLAFHAPGLAPVRTGKRAWHIHPDGTPAYAHHFARTFGFYDGLAAVLDDDGWHHITPDGVDAYAHRFTWCGNFQNGRCPVRDHDAHYFHIDAEGHPAYAQRWRYAGDFRDDCAVVQDENGRSTHIDREGKQTHGRWWLDLDVFHKGFARARDAAGWMHIDRHGTPRYSRRFATVEPFYNGQARVERHDGGLEIIDETGETLVELRAPLRSELAELSADLVGFWRTRTIATAVESGIIEALPGTSVEIAGRCRLNPERTHRVLRALGELSLVLHEEDQWRISPRGELLRREHPQTLADAALEYAHYFEPMWSGLTDALHVSPDEAPLDIFTEVARDPERCSSHHRMLLSYARHDYVHVPKRLPLRGDERIVDAGGGLGFLAAELARHYPDLQITLLDRPEVIAQASFFLPHPQRIELREGNLFDSWNITANAVVLARILHDWNDTDAVHILKRARETLAAGGSLFVIEMLLSGENCSGGLCDLHLLMATGGQERTTPEYDALFAAAGFTLTEIRHMEALPSVLVGIAR